MKKRNLNAVTTKRDLIEFADRVITAIQEYTKKRIERDRKEARSINEFKAKVLPA